MRSLFSSKSSGTHRSVLGVHVTRGDVRAVLVREVEAGVVVVDRFHRYRGDDPDATETASGEGSLPGENAESTGLSDTDYTIEFGGGGSSEAGGSGGLGSGGDDPFDSGREIDAGAHPDQERARPPFTVQLEEIIDECTEAHGSRFDVVFLTEAWGTEVHRVALPRTDEGEDRPDDEALLDRIRQERGEELGSAEVVLHRLRGRRRSREEVLVLIRRSDDSVVATIETLRGGRTDVLPGTMGLLAEPTLFADLVRPDGPLPVDGTAALVRVGSEDTLVLFFEDGELVEQELLKSLSVHDPPDTVCKRVLLHQDEASIGAPDRILVLAEGREDAFVDRFSALNPDVRVRSLFDLMSERLGGSTEIAEATAPAVFAQAQALAWTVIERGRVVEDRNLLPVSLRGRRAAIRLAWHTWAAALLLFAVSLFLAGRYRTQQTRVQDLEAKIQQYPAGLEMTTEQLQGQIDSLQTVYRNYSRALDALDSLLVDSDRWSRMLARVVRQQERTSGVWFETWRSDQTDRIELQGYATERDRVVDIANRLNAAVEQITFEEIRSYPVYRFVMSAPLPGGLPRSVKFLRERDSLSTDSTSITSTES